MPKKYPEAINTDPIVKTMLAMLWGLGRVTAVFFMEGGGFKA